MRMFVALGCALCALGLAVPAAAGTVSIGEHGTTLNVPPQWQRTTADPDIGSVLLIDEANAMQATINEHRGLFQAEADFDDALDVVMARMGEAYDVQDVDRAPVEWLDNGLGVATLTMTATEPGSKPTDIAVQLIGQDTLGYLLVVAGLADASSMVHDQAARISRGIRLGGPRSAWGSARQPTTDQGKIGNATVSITSRRSLLRPMEPEQLEGSVLGLETPDQHIQLYLSPGELPDAIEALSYALGKARQDLVDDLLDSLTIEITPPLLAFPEAEQHLPYWLRPDPATRALFDASTVLADLRGTNEWADFGADGRLVRAHRGGVEIIGLDGQHAEQRAVEIEGIRAMTTVNGALYTRDWQESFAYAADGSPIPVQGTSLFAAAPGGGVWEAIPPQPRNVIGYPDIPVVDLATLRHVGATSEGPTVAVPFRKVTQLLASEDGSRVAVIGLDSHATYGLAEIDTSTLDVRPMGDLPDEPYTLGRHASGWLVGGGWEHDRWLWMSSGRTDPRTIRPAPPVAPLALTGDALIGTTLFQLGESDGPLLVSVPFDAVMTYADAPRPWLGAHLDAIASAALDELNASSFRDAFASDSELDRFLDAADRAAVADVGLPLPRDPRTFDALMDSEDLEPEAWSMLSALLVRAFRGADGRFVPGYPMARSRVGPAHETPFALGVNPMQLVAHTVFDIDGDPRPAQHLSERLAGRVPVFSAIGSRLGPAVAQIDDTDLEALLQSGSDRQIERVLQRWPGNRYLRDHVWEGLLARGRFDVVRDLAKGTPAGIAAEVALGKKRNAKLLTKAWAALEAHPDDPALLLLLGHLFENSEQRDAQAKARACYQRLLDSDVWGAERQAADEALARLDAAQP